MTDIDSNISRQSHWPLGVNLMMTLIISALAMANLSLLSFAVHPIENAFDSFIPGGRAKLPGLTQAVIGWAKLAPLPHLFIVVLAIWAAVLVWKPKLVSLGDRRFEMLILLLVTHWIVTATICIVSFATLILPLGQ